MRAVTPLILVALLFAGCGNKSSSPTAGGGGAGADGDLFKASGDYAGSHILIAYAGAQRAGEDVTRSKEEALEKARGIVSDLMSDPAKFEELARTESDGPSGPNGGSLGSWTAGQMVPEFDTAIAGLEVDAITEEPVETSFGYHVIRRNTLMVPHFGAEAFIVGFAGPQSPPDVTRTAESADSLAQVIKDELTTENFEALAVKHNDFADSVIFLGGFKDGDRTPLPGLIDELKELEVGAVAGPLSFGGGFAFVRRAKLQQRAGAHILVAYEGALRAAPTVTRSKEEALAQATALVEQLSASPDEFASLAEQHSDGPSGPQGGSLGVWFRGQMVPAFDTAIDELDVDEIAPEPVETEFGYHVIQRRALSQE